MSSSPSWKGVRTRQRTVAYLSRSFGDARRKGLTEVSNAAWRLTRSSGDAPSQHEEMSHRHEYKPAASFGVPLDQQRSTLDRGYRIPKLLAVLRRMISDNDLFGSEGLFRVSADARVQALVRKRLEQGEDPEVVLEGCSVVLLSGILKEFLRSLPGGAWLTGDSAAELQARLLQGVGGRPALVLKQALPPAQLQVFLWTLDLLVEASAHSATSLMDDRALAVVFAPLLIPAPSDAAPSEQLRMAQDGIDLLKKMLADHRQTASRAKPTPRPTEGHAAPDLTKDAPPPLLGGDGRGTKRASASEMDAPAPVRRKSSIIVDTADAVANASSASTGLTEYAVTSLAFDV